MRRLIQWTFAPAAVLALACSKGTSRSSAVMGDDLKRDLQLATATQRLEINPDEIAPKSHQELAVRPKEAPSGPKVVRTKHPTVKASATPVEIAKVEQQQRVPEVQAMATAPAPSETPSPAAPPLARPAPVPVASTYPDAAPIPASAGSGGVLAGIFGAVIRGGIVGDDHCDPRGGMRRPPGRPVGGDLYWPRGGMGGTRMPVGIAGRPRW